MRYSIVEGESYPQVFPRFRKPKDDTLVRLQDFKARSRYCLAIMIAIRPASILVPLSLCKRVYC